MRRLSRSRRRDERLLTPALDGLGLALRQSSAMPTPHSQRPDASARQHAIRARDAGLRRISALTRGLAAAAVGLTGMLALVAAGSFHGKTVAATPVSRAITRTASRTSAESETPAPVAHSASAATRTTTQSAAPAAPSPAPAPTPAAAVAVSGGS
jgi:hypothetical protein